VATECANYFPDEFEYLKLEVIDLSEENHVLEKFAESFKFIGTFSSDKVTVLMLEYCFFKINFYNKNKVLFVRNYFNKFNV